MNAFVFYIDTLNMYMSTSMLDMNLFVCEAIELKFYINWLICDKNEFI